MKARFFLAGLVLALASGSIAATSAGSGQPGPGLFLPAGAKSAWVLAPGKALAVSARFDVDPLGGVWVLPVPHALIRADGLGLVLEKEARDLAFGSGGLCLSTDLVAGPLRLHEGDKSRSGWIERKLLLPSSAWRLAKGGSDGVVAFGWDAESSQSVLYRVKDRHKVLAWPDRILAAEGSDSAWSLATPGGAFRVTRQGSATAWGQLPGGISSLTWLEGAGLVVAGPDGAALMTAPGKLKPLILAKSPRVRAHGGALYVLLPEQGGVLKITGLGADAP